MDEARFQKELEEAMRLSSEEASVSSAEIAPCRSEGNADKKNANRSFDHGAILEEVIRETETLAQAPAPDRKRKVEDWVTEQSPRKQRNRPSAKKVVIESSDEEDFAGDVSSDEEEFDIKPSKKSKANKRETKPKVAKRISPRKCAMRTEEPDVPVTGTPQLPLREHNRLAALPKCQNMFQNKSPVKLKVTPRKEPIPVPNLVNSIPALSSVSASPTTPGLSSSLANILGKLSSKSVSSAASKQPPVSPSPSVSLVTARTPGTPVQRKLPSWTPPARAGSGSGGSAAVLASPSIGLRVGLSRNFKKTKSLHPSVKS